MNTLRDKFRQEGFVFIDILIAITGLSFIFVGLIMDSTSWYTHVGAGFLIIALCFMLLSSRARRGWVEIAVIMFILTSVLALFQPSISNNKWVFNPNSLTPTSTNTPSVVPSETFVLPSDKILSDLRIFKGGSSVAVVIVVGNQTYHYNATIGEPMVTPAPNDKTVTVTLILDPTTICTFDTFANQLTNATAVYILPTTATPTPVSTPCPSKTSPPASITPSP